MVTDKTRLSVLIIRCVYIACIGSIVFYVLALLLYCSIIVGSFLVSISIDGLLPTNYRVHSREIDLLSLSRTQCDVYNWLSFKYGIF